MIAPLTLADLMDQHQDRIDQNIHDAASNNDLASLGNGMVQHSLLQQLRDDQKPEAQPVEPLIGKPERAPAPDIGAVGAPEGTIGPFGSALPKAVFKPFGSAVEPTYTGPGKVVAPGQLIPPKQLSGDEKTYQKYGPDATYSNGYKQNMADLDKRIDTAQAMNTPEGQEMADRLRALRMSEEKPWGTTENHPGKFGKFLHVLGRIGNIAGDVFAPATMMNIPGTELNKRAEAAGLQRSIREDEAAVDRRAAQKAAVVGKTPEEQFIMDALHGGPNGTPTVDDQGNPYNYLTAHAAWVESGDVKTPKEETLDNMIAERTQAVLSAKGDPSTDPTIKHLSEVKKGLVTGNLETKNVIGTDGKTYMYTFDPKTGTLGAKLGEVKEPKETQPSTEQVGRTYDRYQSAAEKLSTPVDAALQRSALLVQNLDLKTKQADALIAPELLSIAAGGAGSGLRMNEAEISRVIGGRSVWDALVAKVNQVKEQGGTFDEAQRNQLKQIASYINNRNRAEASVIEQGKDAMLASSATDEKSVRTAYNDMKKKLTAVQRGDWITRAEADAMEKLQPGSSQALVKKGRVII